MNRLIVLGLVGGAIVALAGSSAAADVYVPAELEPWRAWVLEDASCMACPIAPAKDGRACLWPGRLDIDINNSGGRFAQPVEVLAPRSGRAVYIAKRCDG